MTHQKWCIVQLNGVKAAFESYQKMLEADANNKALARSKLINLKKKLVYDKMTTDQVNALIDEVLKLI